MYKAINISNSDNTSNVVNGYDMTLDLKEWPMVTLTRLFKTVVEASKRFLFEYGTIAKVCSLESALLVITDQGHVIDIDRNFKMIDIDVPEPMVRAYCGYHFAILLGVSGKYYGVGRNYNNQFSSENYRSIEKCNLLDEHIVHDISDEIPKNVYKIVCGSHSTFVLTTSRKVYSIGTRLNPFHEKITQQNNHIYGSTSYTEITELRGATDIMFDSLGITVYINNQWRCYATDYTFHSVKYRGPTNGGYRTINVPKDHTLFTGFYVCETVKTINVPGYELIGVTSSFQKNVTLVYRKDPRNIAKMMSAPSDIDIMTTDQ